MPIVTVCKGCGNKMEAKNDKGEPSCPICFGTSKDSGVPIEVRIPEVLKCSYKCGSMAVWSDTKNKWLINKWEGAWGCNGEVGSLPFIDAVHGTYYCGCKGWD